MKENLTQFIGRMSDSDTVMASSRTWVRQMSIDLGASPEDHGIFVLLNIPAIGVMSAGRMNFILSYLTQLMADHPMNAICFAVHANRASQQEGRTEMGKTCGVGELQTIQVFKQEIQKCLRNATDQNEHTNSRTPPIPAPIDREPQPIARKPETKKEDDEADDMEEKVKVKGEDDDEDDGDSGHDSDNDAKKKRREELNDLVRKMRFNLEIFG